MTDLDAHTVLVKGWNLIEREGWRQDPWGSESICRRRGIEPMPGHCSTTALTSLEDWHVDAMNALAAAMGVAQDCIAVGRWNDSHSFEEVRAAWQRAIAATAPMPDLSFVEGKAAGPPMPCRSEVLAWEEARR